MKKYIIALSVILLLITSIISVTYAWFTYVESKSLAEFDAGVLSISLYEDEVHASTNISFDDLAFIDYQNDFIDNQNDMINYMASSHRFDIELDDESPLTNVYIDLSEEQDQEGLIYIIIYEGVNINSTSLTTDYATIVSSIIFGYNDKEDQINAIDSYNEQVINDMSELILTSSDVLTFQVVAWGDYDALLDSSNYLNETFVLSLNITMINDKGEIN